MTRRSRQRVRDLVVATALVVVASCGNSGDDDDAADTTVAASTTATPAPVTTATPDQATTTSVSGPASERDTFVALSGVPGVTDEEIRFASIALKANNPLGSNIHDAYNEGIKAYFEWRNDEGGIFGRDLVLAQEFDDELSRNQERAQEVASSDDFFGVFVSTLLFNGAATLNDAGIPTYIWNIHVSEFPNRPAIFGHTGGGCIGACTGRLVPYIVKTVGATKVGVLGYGVSENSKVCADGQKASIDKYSADIGGAEVVFFNNNLAFGLPNGIGPEVSAMKDAGVEFITTCIDLNGMKTLGEELKRQGMSDVVMYHPNTYDAAFVEAAGDIFEGDYVAAGFLPYEVDTDLEMQEKMVEYTDKLGYDRLELTMIGWINADQAFQALLAAGPEFDRQKVIDAGNTFTAYSAGGLIPPIDWTRQHATTTEDDRSNGPEWECASPVRVEDGGFVPALTTPAKPWICWASSDRSMSEPVAMSFE